MSDPASYKPIIFISHSAKDAVARETLARLYAALNKDYEVLLDRKRLQPTDPWRKELHTWMGLCQGAVVLLSEHAVGHSPWVKKEATVLSYRREMDEQFILVPVYVAPVSAATLKDEKDFAPLELSATQAAAGTVDEIVEQVLASLKPLKEELDDKAPLRKLEQAAGEILSELTQKNRLAMFAAAERLGKRLHWKSDKKYGEQLARELLSADLEKAMDVLEFLAKKISGSGKKLVQILNDLSPFWVDPDAVSELMRMHKRPPHQRAVRVNGVVSPFTGKSYLRRARIDKDLVFATISASSRGWEELKPEAKVDVIIDEIQKQLVLGFEEDYRPSTDEIEAQLRIIGRKEPVYVIVPKGFDEELLAMLRQRLHSFTFFMLGDDNAFETPELKDWQILFLRPELTPGCDRKFNDLIVSKRGDLQRMR
jgi:hypothetical protein